MTATAIVPDVAGTVFEQGAQELAGTYAEALLGAAEAEAQVEPVLGELEELVDDIWRVQPGFAALLASPSVPLHEKDRMIVQTFEGRALPTIVRFLRVLNRHGRLGLTPLVAAEARSAWDRRQNRRQVLVRSAVPLDEAQQASLRERLGRMLGATPIMNLGVDPSLIGGLIVQVGDDVYDASVRSQLEQMRRRLVEEKSHELQVRREAFQVF
jgi:F-type H+-transporting ATPase subunit delta